MEIEKKIRIRLNVLLGLACFSMIIGIWNLSKGGSGDMFALINFALGGFMFWQYFRMKNRFKPAERTWRSYK